MRHPVDYAPSQDFGDNPTSTLPASHWIIQQFGNYQPDGHTGTDYPCPVGTPVRAAADGTVLHIGRLSGTYADNPWWIAPGFAGYTYVVDHGSFIGIYGHCQDGGARVRQGQQVIEGQVLGLSGNTGASTGPHLHFEVLPDGYVLNSYMYGRINPARLFGAGSIATQGTITPTESEEDDDMIDPKEWAIVKLQLAGLVDNMANNHRDTSGRLDKLPAAVVNEPFVRVGKDGQPNGLTTLASVIGAQEANVELDRGLADAPVTVIVDSLIAADIAKEVLDLLAVRLAE